MCRSAGQWAGEWRRTDREGRIRPFPRAVIGCAWLVSWRTGGTLLYEPVYPRELREEALAHNLSRAAFPRSH
jgi:hypothetical protein